MRDLFVVVSGAPGAGKTTLARPLSRVLDLPLIEKDTIKEALGDVLRPPDVASSQRLGEATMRALLALAHINRGAVVESTWRRELAVAELSALPAPVVEVFCQCPSEESLRRYRERVGTRHSVHFDELRQFDELRHYDPVDGGWPVIRVDTTQPVDVDALAKQILSL
jgi:predicted kinase